MKDPAQAPPLLPETLQTTLRQLLDRSRLWCRIPDELQAAYQTHRHQNFRTMLRAVAAVVMALLLLVVIVGWCQFAPDPGSDDGRAWWRMIAITFTINALLIPACRLPAVSATHVPVVTLASGIMIGMQLLTSMVVKEPRFAQELTYLCMISDFAVMLAWRLPAVAGALACIGGLLLATMLARLQDIRPDWPLLFTFHGSAVIYLCMISLVLERADRISFLREMLIRQETLLRASLTRRLDEQHDQLEQLVLQDSLTGLANRRHFDLQLSREWGRLQREQQPLALLFIDVDHFKYYNDYYGHGAGDVCLAQVGAVLQGCAQRPADLAARYGGEEFVLVLPGTTEAGARLVAQRVLDRIDALGLPHERSLVCGHVTVSIGCAATVPGPDSSVAALLKTADDALYTAKHAGRHCLRGEGTALAKLA